MNNFCFKIPQEIRFGAKARLEIGKEAAKRFKHAALFVGGSSLQKSGELDKLIKSVEAEGVKVTAFDGIINEPSIEDIDAAVIVAGAYRCDGVIAVGGGSVLDVGKCVSGLMNNHGSIMDYLDDVGKGYKLENPALPLIAVPTTSGTGSETTNNAVVISTEGGWKRSIRDDKLLPSLVICDPELTLSLPPKQTAESGMDALAQLIEAYTSNKATPISDMAAMAGLKAASALPTCYTDGNDIEARSQMAYAAMMSGIAIFHGGVTACHGFASGFGGAMNIPHGLACAILLPHVMELNRDSLPERYCSIAEALTGERFSDVQEGAHVAVECVRNWQKLMGIPENFKGFDINSSDLERIMNGSSRSSISKNPVQMDDKGWLAFVSDLI